MATMNTLAQAMARRKRNPPPPPIRGLIPGYGQSIEARRRQSKRRNSVQQKQQRGVFGGRPYRSPSAYGRGGPQWN